MVASGIFKDIHKSPVLDESSSISKFVQIDNKKQEKMEEMPFDQG